MADAVKDGGPAFPAKRREQVGMLSDHGIVDEGSRQDEPTFDDVSHPGMTLRDWFAGQALAGLATQDARLAEAARQTGHNPGTLIAVTAYAVADAMLVAREASR